jgi:CHAT domain-containing protein
LFFGEKSQEIYDQAIQTALLLHEMEPGQPYKYKETAFLLCEKSKAAVLAEALAESRARRFAGIPDQLLEEEKKLRHQLNLYDTLLEKGYQAEKHPDPARLKKLEERYFDLKGQYQRLIEYFENRYPKYYELKYNPHPVTVSSLQQALTPRTAVIEYFLGRETMNIFVLTRDKLEAVSIPVNKDFIRIIETFYLAIKKIEAYEFLTLSRQLYQRLLGPIRPYIVGKRKLVVIPHGQLYYVPFEALVPNGLEVGKPSAHDYMVRHFSFSYHYSARLWLQTFRAASGSGSESLGSVTGNISFVGFAPVFDEETGKEHKENTTEARDVVVDGKRFPRLPGTEKEVRAIMQLFQSKGKKAEGYFHANASEHQFKSTGMENYTIIHVATHSLNDFINPRLSGLLFSQSPPAPAQEDGVLYSGETYNLNLNAELIVLSSCETGIGKLVKGEGMIALNRGFLYSGARNTIFSLWKVEDKTTSRLMIELYRDILAGKTFAAALQKAKLKLIQDPFTAFPKYWSGFILVGE